MNSAIPYLPRVLVVEDDPTVQILLAKIFQAWRWEPERAGTVAKAVELLRDGPPFDLVTLDLILPDGDGAAVLAAARALSPPPVVAVTTGLPLAAVPTDVIARADLVLPKPFVFDGLCDLAKTTFDSFHARVRADHR